MIISGRGADLFQNGKGRSVLGICLGAQLMAGAMRAMAHRFIPNQQIMEDLLNQWHAV